jgi:hypothetical protein
MSQGTRGPGCSQWTLTLGLLAVALSGRTPAFGQCQDLTPPAPVPNLSLSNPTSNSVVLTWTAPGDDGVIGTATSYDIRIIGDVATIDNSNWGSAFQVSGEPAPAAAGTVQSMTVPGLAAGLPCAFAIRTTDEAGNVSDFSNTAVGTTHATQSLIIRPTNRGTFAQWGEAFPAVGADHWLNVDDLTADESATFLLDNSWNGTEIDSYVHPVSGIPSGSVINNVQVCVRARQTNVNGTLENNGIRVFIRSGTTNADLPGATQLTTAFTNYCNTWTTNPATGTAWTVAAVDAAEIGARNAMSGGGPDGVELTQVWMVVSYQGEPRLPAKIVRPIAFSPLLADGVTRLHSVCSSKTPDQVANEYVGGLNAAFGQPIYTYTGVIYTTDMPLAVAGPGQPQTAGCGAGGQRYLGFTPAHLTGQQYYNANQCNNVGNLAWDLPAILNTYAPDAERNADAFHEVLLIWPPTGAEFEGCTVCRTGDAYCYAGHDRVLERSGLTDAAPPGGKRYVIHGMSYWGFGGAPGVTEPWLHRTEAILSHIYSAIPPSLCVSGHWDHTRPEQAHSPWEVITLRDQQCAPPTTCTTHGHFPGEGHVGDAHDAVNSPAGYVRSSKSRVPSGAVRWNGFPANFPLNLDLDERRRPATVSCLDWGCSTDENYGEDYLKWFISRLPRSGTGTYDGRYTDWRRYLIDMNLQTGRGLALAAAPTVGPTKGARDLRIEVRDTNLGDPCAGDAPITRTVLLSWTRERNSAGTFNVQQAPAGTSNWQTLNTPALAGSVETYSVTYPAGDTNYRVVWNPPGGGSYVSDTLGIRVNRGVGTYKVGNFSLSLHQSTQITARWTRGIGHCGYGDMQYALFDVTGAPVSIGVVERHNLAGITYMYRHDTGGVTKSYSAYAYDTQGGSQVFLASSDYLVAIPNQSGVDGN